MVVVVDETTNLVYLFGEPYAEEHVDLWARTDGEAVSPAEEKQDFMLDFSFLDLEAFVTA